MPNCAHWLGNEPPVMPLLRRHPGCTDPPLGLFYHEGSWHVAHAHTLQASFLQARAAVLIDTEKRAFPFYGACAFHEWCIPVSKDLPRCQNAVDFSRILAPSWPITGAKPGPHQPASTVLQWQGRGLDLATKALGDGEPLQLPKTWKLGWASNQGDLGRFTIDSKGPT